MLCEGNKDKIEIEHHAMLMLMKCAVRSRMPRASGICTSSVSLVYLLKEELSASLAITEA